MVSWSTLGWFNGPVGWRVKHMQWMLLGLCSPDFCCHKFNQLLLSAPVCIWLNMCLPGSGSTVCMCIFVPHKIKSAFLWKNDEFLPHLLLYNSCQPKSKVETFNLQTFISLVYVLILKSLSGLLILVWLLDGCNDKLCLLKEALHSDYQLV